MLKCTMCQLEYIPFDFQDSLLVVIFAHFDPLAAFFLPQFSLVRV